VTDPGNGRAIDVLHLVGSAVDPFYADLSLRYARDCLRETTDPARYRHHIAYVEPGGRWRFPDGLDPAAIRAAEPVSLAAALAHLERLRPDVAVPQMFCRPGMTSYRTLLDVLGIPFVGNTAIVMALAADKPAARAIVAAAGVSVPAGEVLHGDDPPTIAPPAVVKPADADNSLGVTLVRDRAGYPGAVTAAREHSSAVLVEEYVPLGREVRCGVLVRAGELVCLPLEEYAVDPTTKPIRDHGDKISRADDGEVVLMAKDPTRAWIVDPADPVIPAVRDAARAAHVALGCRDYSLFDFRVDPAGRVWFLEASPYCSFARASVISVMAAAAGIDLAELFGTAIGQAMARGAG
jgi:D-alanine-D-alanine ligase